MFDFSKKNKVSVWASQHPYADIPDEYFEETFSRNNTRATNLWSNNFKLKFFLPDNMETNGSLDGLVDIRQAAGECSFSESYMPQLMSKARKNKMEQVSWIVLLFECEYSLRQTNISKDEYLTFLGAFDYDSDAPSLFEVEG
ncbi:immunity 22 family protein [Oceanospirillum beijerinckii]|uniref:immunity 22 family protein n=1 Tax=Oceanospirillum beijerinckii TaxID=64976 RepID=UPI000404DCEC|nr:immunity 22 family protein [Oceanospirillum beijerinckii]MAC48553.1 hypothetical protein [Oceanospirillum sp.]